MLSVRCMHSTIINHASEHIGWIQTVYTHSDDTRCSARLSGAAGAAAESAGVPPVGHVRAGEPALPAGAQRHSLLGADLSAGGAAAGEVRGRGAEGAPV